MPVEWVMKTQNENHLQSANQNGLEEVASPSSRGFTRLDLMAVIAVLGVLFMILLPALARSGVDSKSTQCLNNNRQLCNAWRMYADDNNDVLPYASTGGGRLGGSVHWTADRSNPNNYAWTGAHMNYDGGNRANWDPAYDMQLRPLWPYAKSTAIYKCPSDLSTVTRLGGQIVPRILSMAMNLYLGGYAPSSGIDPGDSGGWPFAAPYRIFSKTTELTLPGPAKTFVFIDMRPDSANWGSFMQDMTGYNPLNPTQWNFLDVPGMYHNRAASFSFADGHTEMHRWTDPRTTPPLVSMPVINVIGASPNNADVYWLQDHSTALK